MQFSSFVRQPRSFAVYPRLQDLTASYDSGRMQERRAQLPDQECADLGAFGLEFVP